jgi:hypothetical protein
MVESWIIVIVKVNSYVYFMRAHIVDLRGELINLFLQIGYQPGHTCARFGVAREVALAGERFAAPAQYAAGSRRARFFPSAMTREIGWGVKFFFAVWTPLAFGRAVLLRARLSCYDFYE